MCVGVIFRSSAIVVERYLFHGGYIYTVRPRSAAYGREKSSPTVATEALLLRRDLAAW